MTGQKMSVLYMSGKNNAQNVRALNDSDENNKDQNNRAQNVNAKISEPTISVLKMSGL